MKEVQKLQLSQMDRFDRTPTDGRMERATVYIQYIYHPTILYLDVVIKRNALCKYIPYCIMLGYTRHLFPNMLVDSAGGMGSKPTYKNYIHNKCTTRLPEI